MKSVKLAVALVTLFSGYSIKAGAEQSSSTVQQDEKAAVTVVISTQRCIGESIRGKDIQKRMMDEQTTATASFPAMEANIRSKETLIGQLQNSYNDKIKGLETKSKMISEEARNKEIDEIQDIRSQIEATGAERERMINKFNQEAKKAEQRLEAIYKKEMAAFESEIKDVIATAKATYGWDFVHPREALLDASDRFDRTSIIIDLLDKAETKRNEAKLAEKKAASLVKKAA